MSDPITRLNAALESRYRIESELGEGTALHYMEWRFTTNPGAEEWPV